MEANRQTINNTQEIIPEGMAISFAEFKESLGDSVDKYTDEQIEEMWQICNRIADVFFDSWLMNKNVS